MTQKEEGLLITLIDEFKIRADDTFSVEMYAAAEKLRSTISEFIEKEEKEMTKEEIGKLVLLIVEFAKDDELLWAATRLTQTLNLIINKKTIIKWIANRVSFKIDKIICTREDKQAIYFIDEKYNKPVEVWRYKQLPDVRCFDTWKEFIMKTCYKCKKNHATQSYLSLDFCNKCLDEIKDWYKRIWRITRLSVTRQKIKQIRKDYSLNLHREVSLHEAVEIYRKHRAYTLNFR